MDNKQVARAGKPLAKVLGDYGEARTAITPDIGTRPPSEERPKDTGQREQVGRCLRAPPTLAAERYTDT